MGDCGCTGGMFGVSYASCGKVSSVIPVDVEVPGCPPTPMALLQGHPRGGQPGQEENRGLGGNNLPRFNRRAPRRRYCAALALGFLPGLAAGVTPAIRHDMPSIFSPLMNRVEWQTMMSPLFDSSDS